MTEEESQNRKTLEDAIAVYNSKREVADKQNRQTLEDAFDVYLAMEKAAHQVCFAKKIAKFRNNVYVDENGEKFSLCKEYKLFTRFKNAAYAAYMEIENEICLHRSSLPASPKVE